MRNNKITTISITGHRDIRSADEEFIKEKLEKQLLALKNDLGEYSILIGNAAGTDQLALEVIHKLKEAQKLDLKVIDLDKACPRKAHEKNDSYYTRQADFIISHSDSIIALWDGLFTHKPGGTSDIVFRAIGNGKKLNIHHLICPRVSNPYPVASLLGDVIDFENKKFQRIPFAIHFSWLQLELPLASAITKEKGFQKIKNALSSSVFWVYVLPILLVFITLILGTIGFSYKYLADSFLNNLFRSVGLITLEDSVIEGYTNYLLNISRITGLTVVVIVFIYGFYLALARQRKNLLRWFWKKKGNFIVILGLNEKSYDLTMDLVSQNENIVLLNQDKDSIYIEELKKSRNVILISGNSFSGKTLSKLYIDKAKRIYILSDSDTDNIRATQEIDLLTTPTDIHLGVNRFVHINDDSKKRFLQQSMYREASSQTNIFNVHENTVRRLLLHHPIDRFYQSPSANHTHAIIIGFDELGKQLVLALLKQGHYTRDKFLHIHILCRSSVDAQKRFLAAFTQFDHDACMKKDESQGESVLSYTWRNIKLSFSELPTSEANWLDNENVIFKHIAQDQIVSIYACLADGIESATYLSLLLPKIDYHKVDTQCNLQVFCYYNFPDKKEEQIVENQFNKLAPNTYLTCFGNFLDEYAAKAIHNMALDALPKLINANYANIDFSDKANESKVEIKWRNLSESHKSSSRQAADHLWVKLRLIWPEIDWKFDPTTFELNKDVKNVIFKEKLQEYGEIEHRRWCAELLLSGYKPITENTKSEAYQTIATRWNSDTPEDKAMKKAYQARFEHIDLVPFDQLKYHEVQKDIDQLEAIPTYLRAIIETH